MEGSCVTMAMFCTCMKLYFLASVNTILNNLDHTVRHSGFHHNYKEYKYNE